MVNHTAVILYKHRQLGWRFNLYQVDTLPDGTVQLIGPPELKSLGKNRLTNNEKLLLNLLDECSDKSLMKKYSKEETIVNFLKNLSEDKIVTYIRPAIEIYTAQIVELLRKVPVPVFLREEMKRTVFYPEQRILIQQKDSCCVFNFEKDETGLRYFISLTCRKTELSLKDKPEIVITNKPACIILSNSLHVVENIEAKRLLPFFTKDFIAVPPSAEEKYMREFVLKTFLQYRTKMNGIRLVRNQPKKKAILSLEEDFNNRLYLLLTFSYGTNKINPASKKKTTAWIDDRNVFQINWYERDMRWETPLFNKLKDSGLRLVGDNYFYESRQKQAHPLGLISWINSHQEVLTDFELQQNVDQVYYTQDIELRQSMSTKEDWFDIHIEVVIVGHVIPFIKFKKHIIAGVREYVLPDDSILILPEEWFNKYEELFLYGEKSGNNIRLKRLHFSITEKIFQEESTEQQQPDWKAQSIHVELPTSDRYQLRPYQQEGFYWLLYLYNNDFGGCLADDMGLGKTLQTIVLLRHIYNGSLTVQASQKSQSADKNQPQQLSLFDEVDASTTQQPALDSGTPTHKSATASLIVVPTSLIHNWKNEIQRFAPELKVYLYVGHNRLKTKDIGRIFQHYHIVISSYGTVRNDIEYLHDYPFHYLILDESQYIKNADSQTYKAIKQLNSGHRLALTGTPIENSLSDLWAQFNFINEGLLGNYSAFQKTYINPIIRNENKNVEDRLLHLIRPFLLRRTKEEVAPELPPLTQEVVYCDMTEQQQKVYIKERNRLRNSIMTTSSDDGNSNKLIALQGLMRLRLLANHPSLGDTAYTGSSGKFEQIMLSFETLKASGHKVLVFSPFVKHLKLIAAEFDRQGWKYAMLTGRTVNRPAAIARFTDNDDVNCFFISLKAGGTGLNLTVADYVFIIDPWWNPAAEMQALSRAHRIGQEKNVMVYRFITQSTIEEKILHLQEKKKELSSTFITSGNILNDMTIEELQALMG